MAKVNNLVNQKSARDERRKAEAEKQKANRKEAEENELSIFQKGVLYSHAGNKMLHSIAAEVGSEIALWTTSYAYNMKSQGKPHTTTFDAKEALKSLGFRWDGDKKMWVAPFSQELWDKTLPIMRQFDTKYWP